MQRQGRRNEHSSLNTHFECYINDLIHFFLTNFGIVRNNGEYKISMNIKKIHIHCIKA